MVPTGHIQPQNAFLKRRAEQTMAIKMKSPAG